MIDQKIMYNAVSTNIKFLLSKTIILHFYFSLKICKYDVFQSQIIYYVQIYILKKNSMWSNCILNYYNKKATRSFFF